MQNENHESIQSGNTPAKYTPLRVSFAKTLMRLMPANEPNADNLNLNEIFRHNKYLNADEEGKAAIREASSLYRYEEESIKPFFQMYFKNYKTSDDTDSDASGDFRQHLEGKDVLDFGCFTGGKGVRWAKEYGIAKISGTDINPIYMQAASEFAEANKIPHDYRILNDDGSMPFESESQDTVITYDVLEHVNDLKFSMDECLRVLKPGGVMFVVFPSFYNPLESHLDLVTHFPALQWIFSGETLKHAYKDILDEKEASWYKPLGEYSDWEKLPTLNGTTNRSFHQLLKTLDVSIRYVTRTPIMTTGKSYPALRKMVIRPTFAAMLGIRVLDDLLLDRIAVIIEKKK